MKLLFTFLFFISTITLFSQDDELLKLILRGKNDIRDCEFMVPDIMNKIAEKFKTNETIGVDSLVNILETYCGKSESVLRVHILNAILNKKSCEEDIKTYFKQNFQDVFENRMRDSKSHLFDTLYNDNIIYYGYLPLRHPIDSVITNKSKELLQTGTLLGDEKLICILFANGNTSFNKEIRKYANKEAETRNLSREKQREEGRDHISAIISSGIYGPVGGMNRIFGYNPTIRGFITTPLKHKVIGDVGFGIKFNIDDEDFLFYAHNNINTVNSKATLFLDAYVGYKIYDNKKLILIPKLGIGFDSTGTGQKEWTINEENEEVIKYLNLETFNFSAGLSAMIPIFAKNYIGLSLSYHYTPYNINKKLHTEFNNNAMNLELFFRF